MHTLLRITLALALCAAFSLSTPSVLAQQTVLFDFEGFGGDVQGWEPDVAPDLDLDEPARSSVRTLEEKPIGMGESIPAPEGSWMLEGVPNRPILAANFRGMKYTWDSPQDWSGTPLLKLAASMYANGPSSELHQWRIRVFSGEDMTEMIYDGLKSNQGDGTDGNTFVNEWQVLEFDLSDFEGVGSVTSIEAAGRHADTAETGGMPVVAEVNEDGEIVPIDGANWGGLVQIDVVTVEPATGTSTEGTPDLAFLGEVYPNPAASAAQLALEVERPQRVRATVYDVLGRVVLQAFDGNLLPGTRHLVDLDTARLAAGSYVVRLSGESFSTSRRLSVVR
jgi:hypothetical protein